jgi:hypothetical protein
VDEKAAAKQIETKAMACVMGSSFGGIVSGSSVAAASEEKEGDGLDLSIDNPSQRGGNLWRAATVDDSSMAGDDHGLITRR